MQSDLQYKKPYSEPTIICLLPSDEVVRGSERQRLSSKRSEVSLLLWWQVTTDCRPACYHITYATLSHLVLGKKKASKLMLLQVAPGSV